MHWLNRLLPHCVMAVMAFTISFTASGNRLSAEETTPIAVDQLVSEVIEAAGGNAQLLTLFRIEERFNSGKERLSPGSTRTSILEPPQNWWIGKKERGAEPGKIAAWAWTLGILKNAKSQLESIASVTEGDRPLIGLRITGSVDPALDMYFDPATKELVRVDWRNDIYRFSEWKKFEGTRYPSMCVMFRRNSGQPWFFHEILGIERLTELPEGLSR